MVNALKQIMCAKRQRAKQLGDENKPPDERHTYAYVLHAHLCCNMQANQQLAAAQWSQQIDACQCFDQINEPTKTTNTTTHNAT